MDFVKGLLKKNDHVIFVIQSIYIVDYIYKFMFVKPSLYLKDEAYMIMMDDLFDIFLDII